MANSGGVPDAVDIYVGGRVRALRKLRDMSQTALANEVGLTFQQIQKYERGFNRISASTLYKIAGALGTVPAAFFAGLPDPSDSSGKTELNLEAFSRSDTLLGVPGGVEMADGFPKLKPNYRRALVALVRALLKQGSPE